VAAADAAWMAENFESRTPCHANQRYSANLGSPDHKRRQNLGVVAVTHAVPDADHSQIASWRTISGSRFRSVAASWRSVLRQSTQPLRTNGPPDPAQFSIMIITDPFLVECQLLADCVEKLSC
jgi:hypothetical protein